VKVKDLKQPSALYELARTGTIDDLMKSLASLEESDRRRLVLSALASRSFNEEERVRLTSLLGDELGMTWFGMTNLEPPEHYEIPTPSEPGRIGDERREFDRRFSTGRTVAEANFGYVAERSEHQLGPKATPLPPALVAFIEANAFGPRIAAVRQGRAGVNGADRAEVEQALAALDDGARFQLRELLLPKKPLHALRARHAKDDAFQGRASVAKLMRILSGEMFGLSEVVDRAHVDRILSLVANHLPPGSELEWAETLSKSKASARLVEQLGAGALPIVGAFGERGLEEIGEAARFIPLAQGADRRAEVADEAKAYLDAHGVDAFVAALAILDGAGRAELPERGDGWTSIKICDTDTTIPAATALEWLPFDQAVALLDFLSAHQTGVRAALYLMNPSLAEQSASLTMGEDERSRTLVRIVRERGLDALNSMVAHASERIHDFGDNTTPLWKGADWPAQLSSEVLGASVAELSKRTKEMIADLDPRALEALERELLGRRFVAFTYYDPLYAAGVENPEHRYSQTTFDAWCTAETEMRRRADEGMGKPLDPGWLTSLFSDLHAIAGRGIVDAQQTGNMSSKQLGHIRCTDKEQVQLPELVEIDEAIAANLKANKWLGKGTHMVREGSKLKARICFADGNRVPELLEIVDRFVRRNEGKMPIENLIAQVHNALVGIHAPFDGNGRTTKLVIDFLLRRAGIEPMIWRQRHPLKEPTTPETVRTGVQFTHDTVLRHWKRANA
jgi:hypothetical protein